MELSIIQAGMMDSTHAKDLRLGFKTCGIPSRWAEEVAALQAELAAQKEIVATARTEAAEAKEELFCCKSDLAATRHDAVLFLLPLFVNVSDI